MDPRDRPRPLPDGARCTACGASVPTGRIRILARRDDVSFVQLACDACGSAALGLLISSATLGGAPILDVSAEEAAWSIFQGRRGAPPITDADVEAVRSHLATWHGDLSGWLAALERGDPRGSVVDP
jgi:hypothetical protein